MAHFSHALLPTLALLSVPVLSGFVVFVPAARRVFAAIIPHPWQSRAPPRA
jgi:hypothetical protein